MISGQIVWQPVTSIREQNMGYLLSWKFSWISLLSVCVPDDPSRAPRVPRQGVTIPGVENGQKWVVSARPHPSPAQVASIPGWSLATMDSPRSQWKIRVLPHDDDEQWAITVLHKSPTAISPSAAQLFVYPGWDWEEGQPSKISANLQSCKQPGPLLATPSPTPLTLKPWFRRYWASNTSVGLHKAVSQMLTSFLPDYTGISVYQ